MDWKDKLAQSVCTIEELKEHIDISLEEEELLREVIKIHPMRITPYYLSLIDKEDKADPIRKMIVPSKEELDLAGDYDTSGEQENTPCVGLQHKYAQTALILSTNQCGAYCRFCFRKRLVGLPNKEILEKFEDVINYIKEHPEINNVLVSGGDPLILPTEVIEQFLEQLTNIQHLDFIRFGSRVPVTFPARILDDEELLAVLKKYTAKKQIYVVTHFNHPREITEESICAVRRLREANIILNNQTLLIRGVNDDPDVLAELQNRLVKIGVNPYYVFQCRPVKRVKTHFQVPLCEGYEIVEKAKAKLNGHSKRFKYVMSHRIGKIEIVGIMGGEMYFKQHQAKNPEDIGKFFKRKLNKTAGWLDDLG